MPTKPLPQPSSGPPSPTPVDPAAEMRQLLLLFAMQPPGKAMGPLSLILLTKYGKSVAEVQRLERALTGVEQALNAPLPKGVTRNQALQFALENSKPTKPAPK